MARHPPIRHRVQALSTLPVALWRRAGRALAFAVAWLTVWVPGAAVATTLAGLVALWVWAGSASSLEQAVALARPWVPALQTLTLQGADASLRHGGRIQQLAWTDSAGLAVSATDIDFSLDLRPLIHAEPVLLTLGMAQLTVQDDSPPSPDTPTPPADLTLPLEVRVELGIDHLTLAGAKPVHIQHIRGEYRYEGEDEEARHLISNLQLEVAQGSYQANLALQAQAPMALNADIVGTLQTPLPALDGSAPRPWQSPVSAKVRGLLSHEDPLLSTQASVLIQASLGNGKTGAQATGPALNAEATLHPWQAQPIHALSAQLQRLDLAALWPQLPATLLSGQVQAQPAQASAAQTARPQPDSDRWQLQLALTNTASGPWDQGRLPLSALDVTAQATPRQVDVQRLKLQVGQGALLGQGRWSVGQASAQGEFTLQGLPLHALHTQLAPRLASGRISLQSDAAPSANGAKGAPTARLSVDVRTAPVAAVGAPASKAASTAAVPRTATQAAGTQRAGAGTQAAQTRPTPPLSIESLSAQGEWDGQQLKLQQVAVRAAGASLRGQGSVRPQPLAIEGQWRVQAPGLDGQVKGTAAPDSGGGTLTLAATDLAMVHQWLRGLPLPAGTELPTWPLGGDARLEAQWQGGWAQANGPTLQARLSSERISAQPDPQRPAVQTQALQASVSGNLLAADIGLSTRVAHNGLLAQLQTKAHTRATATGQQLTLLPTTLSLRQGNATQALTLQTQQAVTLDWQADRWRLGPGSLQLTSATVAPGKPEQANPAAASPQSAPQANARVRWEQMAMAQGRFSAQGEVERLALDWLDTVPGLLASSNQRWLADAGVRSDLVWGGPWRVEWSLPTAATDAANTTTPGSQAPKTATPGQTAPASRGLSTAPTAPAPPVLQVNLRRLQGDLSLRNPEAIAGTTQTSDWIAAGLQRAEWQLRTEGDGITTRLNWASQLAGQVDAELHAAWAPQGGLGSWTVGPASALRGSLKASTPDMALWSPLVSPPGWRARGQLALNAEVSGTVGQPDWRGELSARDLALRSAVEGLEFGNGRLVARLSGERIDITQLSLEGPGGAQKGGTLTGTGHALWHTSPAGVPEQVEFHLQANASKLRVSSRADRRLALSGEVSATLAKQLLQLRGQLAIDQALFILPDETAPTLGDDVVVRQTRTADIAPTSRIKTDMLVRIDLGQQLEVRGQGLQTRLGGQVSLISTPSAPALRVIGEVNTKLGTYRAYGQQLRIDEGVVRFSGPYDDPSLNILAVRSTGAFRDSEDQVVGVRITGSARAPQVKLYAKPDLPDSEKLAWLVLGRPASGAGAEAAVLQQAALALLSRNGGSMDVTLASRLGLDEISFRGSSTKADGTTQNAGVALGKRLSQRLYVVYETGVNAAMGTVSLLYDVSRRLTLRTRTGEENAVDLLFTIPHD